MGDRRIDDVTFGTDLRGIQAMAHDLWFDLEAIRHDSTTHQFELDLGRGRRPPYRDAVLRVSGVKRFSVRDEARIRFHDLVDVKSDACSVRLISGFPLEITIEASEDSTMFLLHRASGG